MRRLSRSYGVYDGLQPPLALYYSSPPSKPPIQRLFWPYATFACLYRLYTDASSKIDLCGGIIQILVAGYLYKYILFPFGLREVLGQLSRLPGLTARRGKCVWRED